MRKYFGTDGIRGESKMFSTSFVQLVAKGLVETEKPQKHDSMKVLIGGDTRESTEWILRDFERSFETLGIEYGNVGVLPTPAINEVFYQMDFDYAIDVTASHNPAADNGIKIFERGKKSGIKLGDDSKNIIENAIEQKQIYELSGTEIREDLHSEALDIYLDCLREYVGEVNLAGLKIGIDCANGATSVVGGKIFEELGAKIYQINSDDRYGCVINLDSGSTHPEGLQKLVKEEQLDFGAAFDGDGDRCIMVDHNGELVDGDQIIAILAEYLNATKMAISVMANQGLIEWAKDHDIEITITPVGDQNIAEAMLKENIKIGGEQSGHIILPNRSMGDGILTALMVAKVIACTKSSLAELAGKIKKFPQVIYNIPATDDEKEKLENDKNIKKILDDYESALHSMGGRMLVRPSGTENLIRITMWGKNESEIHEMAKELASKIRECYDNNN